MASDFDISKDNEMKVIIKRTKILHLKMRLLERNVQEYSESLKQLEMTGKMHVVQHQETMKVLQETKLQVLRTFITLTRLWNQRKTYFL